MAFGLGSTAPGALQAQEGSQLQEILTDQLGFKAVNGEAKLQLLSDPWPSDNLPIPSASLLSVASSHGLIAAAGPDRVVLVKTDDVRASLKSSGGDNEKSISPMLTIHHSRPAHVAFTADESVLLVSEHGSGKILAYQVKTLENARKETAQQLETGPDGLRALIPNPGITTAHLTAAVTISGQLYVADLAAGKLHQNSGDPVLLNNVSCLSWSNKGKQLVVGLGDGTAVQMTPDGSRTAQLPKPPLLGNDMHVSGISWLENDTFLVIYTLNTTSAENGIPPSDYYIVVRASTDQYTFHKLPEILPPFGMERLPTFHYITRLRQWKPHIKDLLLFCATTSSDIAMITNASESLNPGDPVADIFTFTSPDDDTRRAALPLSAESSLDTSPIGMAIDLSSTEPVVNPIPADPEIQETSGPVPNLLVLNHEGLLCSWWIIYNDSVKQKTAFSGFSILNGVKQAIAAASPPHEVAQLPVPAGLSINRTSLGQTPIPTTAFTQPQSTFGTVSNHSGFGAGSSFTASKIAETTSWTSTGFSNTNSSQTQSTFGHSGIGQPAFGQSGFGQPGLGKPAFGTPPNVASTAMPSFGGPSPTGSKLGSFGAITPAFGQSGFGQTTGSVFANASNSSPFASKGTTSSSSGFGGFAKASGNTFGSMKTTSNETPFGGQTEDGAFGKNVSNNSPFSKATGGGLFGESATKTSAFDNATKSRIANNSSSTASREGAPFGAVGSMDTEKTSFGTGSSFKLESSFRADGTAKDDLPKPLESSFGFNPGFSEVLNDAKQEISAAQDQEAEMADNEEDDSSNETEKERPFAAVTPSVSIQQKDQKQPQKILATPPSTVSQYKSSAPQPVSSLFGTSQEPSKIPEGATTAVGWGFGKSPSTTPKDAPLSSKPFFETKTILNETPADAEKTGRISSDITDKPRETPKQEGAPKIYTESPSDNEIVDIKKEPQSRFPIPPDPLSKPGYQTGDTSQSSMNSSKVEENSPQEFLPSVRTAAANQDRPPAPNDDGSDLSEFDDSGEDVTHEISTAGEEAEDEQEGEAASSKAAASPERSFKGENTTASFTSPSGGFFNIPPPKSSRPLFGELVPTFTPPAPQESPRSPSPVRQSRPDIFRNDLRSASAPVRPGSAIDQRKAEYSQSNIAARATKAREDEIAHERARVDAMRHAQEAARASQMQTLKDDEDERIQEELSMPIQPFKSLDAFITYEPKSSAGFASKPDVPAQIERLYQDINSMVYTLGINARSLSAYIQYQTNQQPNNSWPGTLSSDTPLDALNDEWFLQDVERLHEGRTAVERGISRFSVQNVREKLARCQLAVGGEVEDLRRKVALVRKTMKIRTEASGLDVPLSAEQASIQHDLRRASASFQDNLIKLEEELSVLRARISEMQPAQLHGRRQSIINGTPQKRPTVEAVTNTIAKMTAMAEKRSADIDVLEVQLRKLGITGETTLSYGQEFKSTSTPPRQITSRRPITPGSAASSVYHTPKSRNGGSTPGKINGMISISLADRDRWQAKASRKKASASMLKSILEARNST